MSMFIEIETSRLRNRRFREDDLPALLVLRNDPAWLISNPGVG